MLLLGTGTSILGLGPENIRPAPHKQQHYRNVGRQFSRTLLMKLFVSVGSLVGAWCIENKSRLIGLGEIELATPGYIVSCRAVQSTFDQFYWTISMICKLLVSWFIKIRALLHAWFHFCFYSLPFIHIHTLSAAAVCRIVVIIAAVGNLKCNKLRFINNRVQ